MAEIESPSSSNFQQLHQLPFSKIKAIMTASPDQPKATEEGVFAMTKLAEGFIAMLSRGAQTYSRGNFVEYNHLAKFVHESRELNYMQEILPLKLKFSDVQKMMQKKLAN